LLVFVFQISYVSPIFLLFNGQDFVVLHVKFFFFISRFAIEYQHVVS